MMEEGYNEIFFSIPGRESHEGWKQMERFIRSSDDQDERTCNLLFTAIEGVGTLIWFKNAVYRTDLNERLFEFKGSEDSKEAVILYTCYVYNFSL